MQPASFLSLKDMDNAVRKFLFCKSPMYAGYDSGDWGVHSIPDKNEVDFILRQSDDSSHCLIKVSVQNGLKVNLRNYTFQSTTKIKNEMDILHILFACKIPFGQAGKKKWEQCLAQIAGEHAAMVEHIDEAISCIRSFLYDEEDGGFPLGAWDEKLTGDGHTWRFKYVGDDQEIHVQMPVILVRFSQIQAWYDETCVNDKFMNFPISTVIDSIEDDIHTFLKSLDIPHGSVGRLFTLSGKRKQREEFNAEYQARLKHTLEKLKAKNQLNPPSCLGAPSYSHMRVAVGGRPSQDPPDGLAPQHLIDEFVESIMQNVAGLSLPPTEHEQTVLVAQVCGSIHQSLTSKLHTYMQQHSGAAQDSSDESSDSSDG